MLDPATRIRLGYAARGLLRRFIQPRLCPCCGASDARRVDRKFPYGLYDCRRCHILFRHPTETAAEMEAFYESGYAQAGLTTDLPGEAALAKLLADGFAGSEKDFSRVVHLLQSLGVNPGARVLDYGANWGYGTWQLRHAGYDVAAFEPSTPRAAFGAKLGVQIATDVAAVGGGFDVVYSSHVLEHVPNPLQSLREQLALCRQGGFVIAHTPNGSAERRQRNFTGFHRHWGRVHPVLLSGEFVLHNFADQPCYAASDSADATGWDRNAQQSADLGGSELLLVIRAGGAAA